MKVISIVPLFFYLFFAPVAEADPSSGYYVIKPNAYDRQGYVGCEGMGDPNDLPKRVSVLDDTNTPTPASNNK